MLCVITPNGINAALSLAVKSRIYKYESDAFYFIVAICAGYAIPT